MLEYSIERLETLSSSCYFSHTKQWLLNFSLPLDEHLKEIADLCAQAFAGGVRRSVKLDIQCWLWTDVAWTTLISGDWSLNTEYCSAVLHAAILEGEVYILTIERGGKREIASWVVLFPPGRALFGTQVSCTFKFVDSFQTNQTTPQRSSTSFGI